MGRALWRCIEQRVHRDSGALQRKVLPADIARATGLSAQLVSTLQNEPKLPQPATLAAVRDGLGIPYRTLLDAALTDRGWLPEPPVGGAVDPEVAAALGHVHEVERRRRREGAQPQEHAQDEAGETDG